ncbi:pyridoxamine 5'-phosphate oxidase family protein [Gordonia sp. L191]|uniref:pyridoxamine 5'-phosphate oxidase family protein n=1 Tax=Gordonia sp. L191 TaxID=2982699 RepID=UPI0024C0B3C5|nr:pyridoxamine 5'-phosphate oxidase family protein [Gordonia sp. L191]WHU49943.1 pyridoxamine 5'-phosphate oxidase family protein [Gordonia sp. L191]
MPDGSPQLTQTWVDTDGEHVLVNTVQGFQKDKNIQRDPRVSINVSDPDNPARYFEIRGRVIGSTTDGGAEHIEALSQKYLGAPYPWFGGCDQTTHDPHHRRRQDPRSRLRRLCRRAVCAGVTLARGGSSRRRSRRTAECCRPAVGGRSRSR